MADNRSLRDGRDRAQVSKQLHELRHLARKHNITVQAAAAAQRAAGPNRTKVETHIRIKKKIGHFKPAR